jgi:hypothetical protein
LRTTAVPVGRVLTPRMPRRRGQAYGSGGPAPGPHRSRGP